MHFHKRSTNNDQRSTNNDQPTTINDQPTTNNDQRSPSTNRHAKRYYHCHTILLRGTPVYRKAPLVEMDIDTGYYLLLIIWRWYLFILDQQWQCH